jgi:hypothetical protein
MNFEISVFYETATACDFENRDTTKCVSIFCQGSKKSNLWHVRHEI